MLKKKKKKMHSSEVAHGKRKQQTVIVLWTLWDLTFRLRSLVKRSITKTQTAGTENKHTHTHLLEEWQSIATGEKNIQRKTSGQNHLGKNTLHYQGWRSATSTFLIQCSLHPKLRQYICIYIDIFIKVNKPSTHTHAAPGWWTDGALCLCESTEQQE